MITIEGNWTEFDEIRKKLLELNRIERSWSKLIRIWYFSSELIRFNQNQSEMIWEQSKTEFVFSFAIKNLFELKESEAFVIFYALTKWGKSKENISVFSLKIFKDKSLFIFFFSLIYITHSNSNHLQDIPQSTHIYLYIFSKIPVFKQDKIMTWRAINKCFL